jgi:hypothetical protein
MAPPGWQYKVLILFRTGVENLRAVVRDANPVYRCILRTGVVAVVAVVIALSTASRCPYTGANSGSWHTSKASRMNPACPKVGGEVEAPRCDPESERQPRSDGKLSFLAFGPPLAKSLFVRGVDKFRSPPTLF